MRPRWAGGAGNQARVTFPMSIAHGLPLASLPHSNIYVQKTLQKPLKPIFYSAQNENKPSGTVSEYTARAWGLVETASPQNPPITSASTPTHAGGTARRSEKSAPSALKLLNALPSSGGSSAGGFRGVPFSTPYPLAFGSCYLVREALGAHCGSAGGAQ